MKLCRERREHLATGDCHSFRTLPSNNRVANLNLPIWKHYTIRYFVALSHIYAVKWLFQTGCLLQHSDTSGRISIVQKESLCGNRMPHNKMLYRTHKQRMPVSAAFCKRS